MVVKILNHSEMYDLFLQLGGRGEDEYDNSKFDFLCENNIFPRGD